MWYLTKLAIKSRFITILLASILTAASIWGTLQLKMELIPDFELPFTTVLTIYPDGSPEQVADEVSAPIEEAIWERWEGNGLRAIESTSADGISIIFMEFEYGTAMQEVNDEIREELKLLDFPEQVIAAPKMSSQIEENPRVMPIDIADLMPLVILTVGGDRPAHLLTEIAENRILVPLRNVKGVFEVHIDGAEKDQLLVAPDPLQMNGNNVSLSQIAELLINSSEVTQQSFDSLSELNNIPVTMAGVTLGDVADISLGPKPTSVITRTNGKPSIAVMVAKERDANTVEVANAVVDKIKEIDQSIKDEFGEDIELVVLMDQSDFIEDSISQLAQMAAIGFALAAVIVFLFFMVFRASLITAMSIPLSIVIGFLIMYLTGVTINLLTLSAMAIAVGRLIDNSIVIVEVIYRRIQEGESIRDATINGSREVAGPITSSTLATVAIFIPIIFVGGIIAEFFLPFGLTITYALLASLFVALMVVPAFSNYFARKKPNGAVKSERATSENWYQRLYLSSLKWALAHRFITVLVAFILFVGSAGLIPVIGTSFMPEMSEKMLIVTVQMPPGTGLQETGSVTGQVEDVIDEVSNDLEGYGTSIGTSTSIFGAFSTAMGGGDNTADITIMFESDADLERERSELDEALKALQEQIPGSFIKVSGGESMMAGYSDVDISIQGNNTTKIAEITALLHSRLETIEGIANLESQVTMVVPQLTIEQDEQKIAELTLQQQQQLMLEFQLLTMGGNIPLPTTPAEPTNSTEAGDSIVFDANTPVVEIDIDDSSYKVFLKEIVSKAYSYDNPKEVMSSLSIGFPTFSTLGDIADVQVINEPTHISRIDLKRAARIQGSVTKKDVGTVNLLVKEEIEKLEEEVDLGGVEIVTHGVAEDMEEMFSSMFIAIIAAIFIAYAIVAISMRSILNPIIIMISLPLASIGALLGLLISGHTLGMSAMMGMLMLVGIVLTNAIVLIDLVQRLRKEGLDTRESLLNAGKTRLRPILMTALTTMIAMVPVAVGVGEGGIIAAELAVVVIGGLFSSTLLTILVIPVIYSLVDSLRRQFGAGKV